MPETKTITLDQKLKIYKDHIEYLSAYNKDYNNKIESKVQSMITDTIFTTIHNMSKAINIEVTGKEF